MKYLIFILILAFSAVLFSGEKDIINQAYLIKKGLDTIQNDVLSKKGCKFSESGFEEYRDKYTELSKQGAKLNDLAKKLNLVIEKFITAAGYQAYQNILNKNKGRMAFILDQVEGGKFSWKQFIDNSIEANPCYYYQDTMSNSVNIFLNR